MLEKVAVFFDVDDTLLDNYLAFKWTIRKYSTDSIFDEKFLKRFYRKFHSYSEKINQGGQKENTNSKQKNERWLLVMETLEMKKDIKVSDLDDYYHLCQSNLTLSNEMNLLLNVLKKSDIFCGILTNGSTQQQRRKIQLLELDQFIDPKWQFISESLGDAKPNVSCFRKVTERLPKEITKIYYLGDSYQNDIRPALSANWHPIWLNRFDEEEISPILQVKTEREAVITILSQLLHFE